MRERTEMREMLLLMRWWYILAAVVFSLYYAIRAVIEASTKSGNDKYTKAQKIFVVYTQEFLFKLIFTISGFFALSLAYNIFTSLKSLNDISAGVVVLLVFLFIGGGYRRERISNVPCCVGKISWSKLTRKSIEYFPNAAEQIVGRERNQRTCHRQIV